MTRLIDYANDVNSQFGEDGCIGHIFDVIGVKHHVAVEFGASDGLTCSNTAQLWRQQGWLGFLVEADAERFALLEGNAGPYHTISRRALVQSKGPYSISALLAEHEITELDLMSIDIDGNDYYVFNNLTCRPRVVIVEFNPTVPPQIDLYPEPGHTSFGSSLLALIRLGERMDYRFVGATYCNAFFVVEEEAAPFDEYETDPNVLCADRQYTYAVSDMTGRMVLCGQRLPWGARAPYVLPLAGDTVFPVSDDTQFLRRGFESEWGPAVWFPPSWANLGDPDSMARGILTHILGTEQPQLVCLDLSNEPSLDTVEWLWPFADLHNYEPILAGRVLGLVRKDHDG